MSNEIKEPNASVFGDGIAISLLSKLDNVWGYMTDTTKDLVAGAKELVVNNSKSALVAALAAGSLVAAMPAHADMSKLNNPYAAVSVIGLATNVYEMASGQQATTESIRAAQMASQVGTLSGSVADSKNAGGAAAIGTLVTYLGLKTFGGNQYRQVNVYGQNVLVDQQNRVFDANTRNQVGMYNPNTNQFFNNDGTQVLSPQQRAMQQNGGYYPNQQVNYQQQAVYQQQIAQQQQTQQELASKFDNIIRPNYDKATYLYAQGNTGKEFHTACKAALGSMDRAANIGLGQRYSQAQSTLYQMGCSVTNGMTPN